MSDTAKRDAVLEEFAHDAGVHRVWGVAGMADEILRLRAENTALKSAVERVRALHNTYPDYKARWCRHCATQEWPCPTLRALEEAP